MSGVVIQVPNPPYPLCAHCGRQLLPTIETRRETRFSRYDGSMDSRVIAGSQELRWRCQLCPPYERENGAKDNV